jgi:hypothetical protein
MPILLAGTIEIVHIEQVSALFTFRLGQVLLYYIYTMQCNTGGTDVKLPIYIHIYIYTCIYVYVLLLYCLSFTALSYEICFMCKLPINI